MADEFRLDELAQRAEVASTTVRLYRNRGLLPPPRLVGRTGWYDAGHLNRLRLITRLQSQGFSLSGIGELLEQWKQGRSLDAMLGVEDQLGALLGEPHATTLVPSQLASLFPDEALTVELMQRATGLGLVEPLDSGDVRVVDRRFIGAGATLAHLGIPLAEILDEWEALRAQTDQVANRFITLFEHHLVPDDWRTDLSNERSTELAGVLAQLRATAHQVLAAALDASIGELGREHLGGLLPDG
ncbi:MAG: MerR family transcriptional regulator [Candidatus Microthrix subdominans]